MHRLRASASSIELPATESCMEGLKLPAYEREPCHTSSAMTPLLPITLVGEERGWLLPFQLHLSFTSSITSVK